MDLYEHIAMVLEIDQQKRFDLVPFAKLRFLDDPLEIEIVEHIKEMRKKSKTYRAPLFLSRS